MENTKILLIDTMPFSAKINNEIIKESTITNIGSKLFVEGPVHKAGIVNQNFRVYPKAVLVEKVQIYDDIFIKGKRAFGELDHPDSNQVSLQKASHTIEKLYWDGDILMGVIEVLDTLMGDIVRKIIQAGKTIGISSRGLGSVKKLKDNIVEVQNDYDIICWDFVSDPSTPGAFLKPSNLKENKQLNLTNDMKKYYYVNLIANDILRNNNLK